MTNKTQAVTVRNGAELGAPGEMTREQIELLKRTICKGATDDELNLFAEVCRRKRLDPFAKQIHAVKRKTYDDASGQYIDTMTYQTGIDGFRAIADRTGTFNGQDAPEWCGRDGKWVELWTSEEAPFAARVRVYRKGIERPFVGTAEWRMYCQTKRDGKPTKMWNPLSSGPFMLAKCAAALALRMGFPEELGGLHTPEEIEAEDDDARFSAEDGGPAVPAHNPKGKPRTVAALKADLNARGLPAAIGTEIAAPSKPAAADLASSDSGEGDGNTAAAASPFPELLARFEAARHTPAIERAIADVKAHAELLSDQDRAELNTARAAARKRVAAFDEEPSHLTDAEFAAQDPG